MKSHIDTALFKISCIDVLCYFPAPGPLSSKAFSAARLKPLGNFWSLCTFLLPYQRCTRISTHSHRFASPPVCPFLNSAGPAVGNNIIHYKCRIIPSCPRFPHLRKFIPLQQKSQLERFQLPPILSSPFHQLRQQEYLWGCSVRAYSAAPSSCDVLAFRC